MVTITGPTLAELISDLESVRKRKAEIEETELSIMRIIIATVKHGPRGSKTYQSEGTKFTIKTGENYTLDKAKLNAIWTPEMPINRAYSYTLREKDFNAIMATPGHELRSTLADVVTSKPAKPSITISN